jgi:hypothetical protein
MISLTIRGGLLMLSGTVGMRDCHEIYQDITQINSTNNNVK